MEVINDERTSWKCVADNTIPRQDVKAMIVPTDCSFECPEGGISSWREKEEEEGEENEKLQKSCMPRITNPTPHLANRLHLIGVALIAAITS
jgi:hypothetical protein